MAKERHFAEVTRILDPDEGTKLRGAIFFKSETLTGDVEYPDPAEPCFIFAGPRRGFFVVPEPGDIVEIEIDSESEAPNPIWLCMVYSEEDELPREFITNYGKRMGFVSKSGHLIIMDDTDGSETMFFEHQFGSKLEFFADGGVSLKSREVTLRDEDDASLDVENPAYFGELFLDYANKMLELADSFENSLSMAATGIIIEDINTNIIDMDITGILLQDINSNKHVMNASGHCIEDAIGNKIQVGTTGITITDVAGNTIEIGPAGINIISIGPSMYDAPVILLAGGGPPAARLGDIVTAIGNLGAPAIGQIALGSTKVLVG